MEHICYNLVFTSLPTKSVGARYISITKHVSWKPYSASFAYQNIRNNFVLQIMNSTIVV